MSEIEDVKKLRKLCGAGFKDCLSALKEAKGNIEKALEILRVKGISKATKKMSRVANEGVIAVSGNRTKISLLEVNCETDFVAKNDDFVNFVKEISDINNNVNSDLDNLKKSKMNNSETVENNLISLISKIGEKITIGRSKTFNYKNTLNFSYLHTVVKDNLSKLAVMVSIESTDSSVDLEKLGKELSMHIAALNPIAIDSTNIDTAILDKEQNLVTEELKNSGKPEDIVKKISIGKLNKFKEENSLLSQAWVMEPKKKVGEILKEISSNVKIKDFYRLKIGE